jgi:hypothetical protein
MTLKNMPVDKKIEDYPQEWQKVFRGEIPWDYQDFLKATKWYSTLLKKPKDQWKPLKGSLILELKGKITELRINKNDAYNQFDFYLRKKYGTLARAHGYRFLQIDDFLTEHKERLFKEGLAIKRKHGDDIRGEMIKVLCAEPYTKEQMSKNGHLEHKFDYEKVIAKARTLISN